MSTKHLEQIREMLCDEIADIAEKGELSAGTLDTVDKITHTMKNIDKIMEHEEMGEYSGDGDWTARGTYGRSSYRRGGSSYRRDRMGRYSRSDSADNAAMIDRLEHMLEKATSREEQDAIRKCIDELERG